MERLLSKRMQLSREVTGTTEQKANATMKREVNRELKDSSKPSRNGDVVVDPVTGHQTVRSFRRNWYVYSDVVVSVNLGDTPFS